MAFDKEKLTLGEYLRQERERRAVTIEQVASATRIGVRTLHALEADQYAELPAKPFIRGFVVSYCRFIGVDGKDILGRFDDFLTLKATERPNREGGHSGYAFERKDGEQGRTILLIAIMGFTFLGGLALVFLKPKLKHRHSAQVEKLRAAHMDSQMGNQIDNQMNNQMNKKKPGEVIAASTDPALASKQPAAAAPLGPINEKAVTPPASLPVALPLATAAKPAPQPQVAQVTPPVQTKPAAVQTPTYAAGANTKDPLDSGLELKQKEIRHRVVFKVLSDIWVRYQADDRPMRKFIVRKGRTLVLRGKAKIKVQISDPLSVEMSYNGGNFTLVNQDKRIVTKRNDATLFFPSDLSKEVEKPFGDDPPLAKTVAPKI